MRHISFQEYTELPDVCPIVDVRSPGEYAHGHIPGAYSLPLFTDEERKIVGTLYKHEGREAAIKAGLDYYGTRMRTMVEATEALLAPGSGKTVMVHCWRGGMRSAGVSWLLDLYGFKVYILQGGYKAFRNWVLAQFALPYRLQVLGGYTGSGKTAVLGTMRGLGHAVIDLEDIASHRGSAFGAIGQAPQPAQELFENQLAMSLYNVSARLLPGEPIWLEDESRRIGQVNLPAALWETMQRAPLHLMDVPQEERLDRITQDYGSGEKSELADAINRIQKRLGGQQARAAIQYLQEDNYRECFRILLYYYDKYYRKALAGRHVTDFIMP